LPDDFTLSPADRKFSVDRGVNPDLEFEIFCAKARAHNWKAVRWHQKFSQWVLQEVKFRADREKRNGATRPAPRKVQSHAEMLKARSLT
jgi:hypothetical protein